MSKYLAHDAIIATGPGVAADLPDVAEFAATIPEPLRPLLLGPVQAPGDIDGVRFATYVFLPDGEDSWHAVLLGGDDARRAFVQWLAEHARGFTVVLAQFGDKPYSEKVGYPPHIDYLAAGKA